MGRCPQNQRIQRVGFKYPRPMATGDCHRERGHVLGVELEPPKVYVVSCQKGKRYPGLSMLERYGRHYLILTPFADSLSSIKNQFASIFFPPKGQSDVSKVICPQSGADRRHRFLKGRVK